MTPRALLSGLRAAAIVCLTAAGAAAAPPDILNLTPSAATVPKHQRIEFRFDLSKSYPNPDYYYDPADTVATNPASMTWVGANGVSVDLKLTAPSGQSITVPAFFFHDYLRLRDTGLNLEVLGKIDNGRWAARFTPSEVGTYQYYVTAQDADGTSRYPASGTLSFAVTASSTKGFVRQSVSDPRFLAYDDGSAFVPIGGGRQWWNNNAARSYDYETAFATFRSNGVNLTRIWNQVDFALSVEGSSQPVWVQQGTTYGAAQGVEVDTANVHGGLRSARPAPNQGWLQRLAIAEPTRLHKLTVWIKTDAVAGGQAQASVRAGATFGAGTVLGQTTGVTGTTPWTAYSITLTPNTSIVSLSLFQTGGTGTTYVDDIAFGPVDGNGNIVYNVASDADFERHFFKDNPGNDPNSTPALARPIGTFMNPWASYEMDRIVESAETNGVRIQACTCSGPWFTWPVNPGDMSQADFAQPWTLNSYKRNLRQHVARWGYSPAILGWELHNEWGHINSSGSPNQYNMIVAINAYLAATDPYRHLRTTSQNSQAYSPQLWSASGMDAANYHWYLDGHIPAIDPDEAQTIMRFAWCLTDTRGTASPYCTGLGLGDGSTWTGAAKPWVWGEIGVGLDGTQGNTGEAGSRFLHNIVWAGLFTPIGTTPLEWWWYQEDATATTAKYASRRAASAFFADVNYAAGAFTYLMTPGDGPPTYAGETLASSSPQARAYGMRRADRTAAYLWVQHRGYTWGQAATTPSAIAPTITIGNLQAAPYRIELWNTTTGSVISQTQATPTAGALAIAVGSVTSDVAVKLTLVGGGGAPAAPTNLRVIVP
jgi:hypothetical protein